MSTAEAWTIGRLLTWTAEYLKKYGSTSPRLDAEVLDWFKKNGRGYQSHINAVLRAYVFAHKGL